MQSIVSTNMKPELPKFLKQRESVVTPDVVAAKQLVSSVRKSRKTIRFASTVLSLPLALISLFPAKVDAQSATYYHPSLAGRKMANGQPYRPGAMTAASNYYRLGTRVKVTNRKTGKSVIVVITDRCGNCSIDLSSGAFQRIAPLKQGRVPVRVQKL